MSKAGILKELWMFLRVRKKWWLGPVKTSWGAKLLLMALGILFLLLLLLAT